MSLHSIVNNRKELEASFRRHLERSGNGVLIQPSVDELDVPDISRKVILDLEPADDGNKHTPDNWHTYWNRVTDGRIMAALSDYYHATKQIKYNREHNRETDLDRKLLASIRKDFQESFVCCDDRLIYGNKLDANIICHFSSEDTTLRRETNLKIKEYRCVLFETALKNSAILKLMQFLCGTTDNKNELIKTFEVMSNKTRDKLYFWTPEMSDRASHPERAVFLYYGDDGFHILCYCSMDGNDRSRGVKYT